MGNGKDRGRKETERVGDDRETRRREGKARRRSNNGRRQSGAHLVVLFFLPASCSYTHCSTWYPHELPSPSSCLPVLCMLTVHPSFLAFAANLCVLKIGSLFGSNIFIVLPDIPTV